MPPRPSLPNVIDSRSRDAKAISNALDRHLSTTAITAEASVWFRSGGENIFRVLFGQLRHSVKGACVAEPVQRVIGMLVVLRSRHVFQVVQRRVALISVLVINLQPRRLWSNECEGHQKMDRHARVTAFGCQRDTRITQRVGAVIVWLKNLVSMRHSPEGTDCVSWQPWDYAPLFISHEWNYTMVGV